MVFGRFYTDFMIPQADRNLVISVIADLTEVYKEIIYSL